MQDISDRYQVQSGSALSTASTAKSASKQIGGYLVEAGLLTSDQINVALNDQQATGMRFGEIIVARGWLKEQTVEWIVSKVIEPERQQTKANSSFGNSQRPPSLYSSTGHWPSGQAHRPAPRDTAAKPAPAPTDPKVAADRTAPKPAPAKTFVRREAPISKPLPSVGSSDGDVNWVG